MVRTSDFDSDYMGSNPIPRTTNAGNMVNNEIRDMRFRVYYRFRIGIVPTDKM